MVTAEYPIMRVSKLFTHKTEAASNYTEEYCQKPRRTSALPYRTRNIPHLHESFMVLRLLRRFNPLIEHSLQATAQLNPEQLIAGHKVLSTYQRDYTSLTQGRVSMPGPTSSKPATHASKGLATSMQVSYTIPRQGLNLKGNTTRYGCSKGIVRAAQGIVPTLANVKPPLTVSYQTWYESEFSRRKPRRKKPSSQLKLPKINASGQPQLITSVL